MSSRIHPTAIVDPSAELAEGVEVGPGAIIGPGVEIGRNTQVGAGAQVQGPTRIGRNNLFYPLTCIGFDPQDLKHKGQPSRLEIGDDNRFREYTSVHRGTESGEGVTRIGSHNFFMAYSHVGHDSRVGDRTVFTNGATLAGHVEVHDDAVIGAYSAVHQFCRVGRFGFIGGYSVITQDALPFVRTVGHKPVCLGINRVGLERKGIDKETVQRLEASLRILLRSELNTSQALDRLRAEHAGLAEVEYLVKFVEGSQRGVIKRLPGGRRARGGGPD